MVRPLGALSGGVIVTHALENENEVMSALLMNEECSSTSSDQ